MLRRTWPGRSRCSGPGDICCPAQQPHDPGGRSRDLEGQTDDDRAFSMQHDPDFLPNGNIMLFDNWITGRHARSATAASSRSTPQPARSSGAQGTEKILYTDTAARSSCCRTATCWWWSRTAAGCSRWRALPAQPDRVGVCQPDRRRRCRRGHRSRAGRAGAGDVRGCDLRMSARAPAWPRVIAYTQSSILPPPPTGGGSGWGKRAMTSSHRNAASPSPTSPSLGEEISARVLYMRCPAPRRGRWKSSVLSQMRLRCRMARAGA